MPDMLSDATVSPTWLFAAAVGLAFCLALFSDQVRRASRAIADVLRDVLYAGSELLGGALSWTWHAVRPSNAVNPLRASFGIILFALAVGAVIANYRVMEPTLGIILPFEDASRATAFVIVAFTGALGVLLHFAAGRVATVGICLFEVALLAAVAVLAWLRTVAVQHGAEVDLPGVLLALDRSQPVIATVLTVMLQIAEFAVFWGAITLADETLPILLVSPVMGALGAGWILVHLLQRGGIDKLLASLTDELVGAACAARDYVRRLLHGLTREARRQSQHQRDLDGLRRASESMQMRSDLSGRSDTSAWARARETAARDAATAHERALAGSVMAMEKELVEKLAQSVRDNSEKFAADIMASALEHIRAEIEKELALAAPSVVKEVARSAFAAVRPFTYFGVAARSADKLGSKTIN